MTPSPPLPQLLGKAPARSESFLTEEWSARRGIFEATITHLRGDDHSLWCVGIIGDRQELATGIAVTVTDAIAAANEAAAAVMAEMEWWRS